MKLDIDDFRVPFGKKVHLEKWPTRVDPVYQSKEELELTRFGGQTKPGVFSQEVHRHGNPKAIPRRVQA
jgi:hypothetical protein